MLNPYFGNVRGAYLIGEAAQVFANALADAMPITVSGTLDQAVADAAMQAKSDHLDAPIVLCRRPAPHLTNMKISKHAAMLSPPPLSIG